MKPPECTALGRLFFFLATNETNDLVVEPTIHRIKVAICESSIYSAPDENSSVIPWPF
jgi:hypothetical protein